MTKGNSGRLCSGKFGGQFLIWNDRTQEKRRLCQFGSGLLAEYFCVTYLQDGIGVGMRLEATGKSAAAQAPPARHLCRNEQQKCSKLRRSGTRGGRDVERRFSSTACRLPKMALLQSLKIIFAGSAKIPRLRRLGGKPARRNLSHAPSPCGQGDLAFGIHARNSRRRRQSSNRKYALMLVDFKNM